MHNFPILLESKKESYKRNETSKQFHLEREGGTKAKQLKQLAMGVWSNWPHSDQEAELEPGMDFHRVNDRCCYQWWQGHRSSNLLTIYIIRFIHHYARNCVIVIYIVCCSLLVLFKINGEFLCWAEEFCQENQLAHISIGIHELSQTRGPSCPVLSLWQKLVVDIR